MSEATETPNRRRARDDVETGSVANGEGGTRKRRAFLQTMGQQLREFGVDGTSPQDHGRTTFGPSPGSQTRPISRSANLHANHSIAQNVDTPESDAAPGEDDQIPAGSAKSSTKWLWKVGEVLPPTPAGTAPELNFEDLLDWSQSYFDHWHPAFPFLHAPSLIDYIRGISRTGLQLPASTSTINLQHVILRSIMSISVADRRQMNASRKALPSILVFHSFNDAISSIQLVLTEESSILSLQALVSVQLFLITMHRYNAASRLEGLAIRMCFQLGLHRCPHRTLGPSKEAELRKRMFWSIYCIDRYICIRLGTPLGVRSDETDVCFPHDEQHNEDVGNDAGVLPSLTWCNNHVANPVSERDDRLSLLEFLARHASIRGAIMENRNKSALRADPNEADKILEVEAGHTRWWNTVDEYLSDDEGTRNIIKAHQVTLIVLRFESILALHRSVLATSKKNSTYNAALQRCISASRSIINTLHKALRGFGAFDGSPGQRGYESTPLVWPSFTWAVWMSVFIVVFAATEGQFARDIALRLADRSIQILQHLALRGTSWPEACIVAVQNLTSRLRDGSTRSSTAAPGHTSTVDVRNRTVRPGQDDHTNYRGFDPRRSGQVTPRGNVVVQQGIPQNMLNHPSFTPQNATGSIDTYGVPEMFSHVNGPGVSNPASVYLTGSGNFLGIGQNSSDNPLPNDEIMRFFNGEDMGFWSGGNLGYGGNFAFQE
jgi:hypothetical protein